MCACRCSTVALSSPRISLQSRRCARPAEALQEEQDPRAFLAELRQLAVDWVGLVNPRRRHGLFHSRSPSTSRARLITS